MNIRRNADLLSGLLFAALGGAALLLGRHYEAGTASQMGPGYFPRSVAIIVLVLGAAIVLRALFRDGPDIRAIAVKPLVWIVGSVLAFALLLDGLGFVIAAALLIVGCRLGGRDFRFKEVLLSVVVMVGASVLIFSYGLTIPLKLWPF